MSDSPRISVVLYRGTVGIYEHIGTPEQQGVVIRNHIEAEHVVRVLEASFGGGRFKVIRQRNSEGRFEP